jgi:hypothetical protein
MVMPMPTQRSILLAALLLPLLVPVLARATEADGRVPVNTPAIIAELQAARSTEEFSALQKRHAGTATLTVAKALELHVPSEYAVFPHPDVDLFRTISFNRSINWSDALQAALHAAGIDTRLNIIDKTIQLAPNKAIMPVASK